MIGGLILVAQVWHGMSLDGVGVAAGLLAAVALSVYYLMGERLVGAPRPDLGRLLRRSASPRSPGPILLPWWSFPTETLRISVELPHGLVHGAGLARSRCGGSCSARSCPFSLSVAALKHLPATTVGIVATFEPVAAAVVAWVWLGEALVAVADRRRR